MTSQIEARSASKWVWGTRPSRAAARYVAAIQARSASKWVWATHQSRVTAMHGEKCTTSKRSDGTAQISH